MRHITSKLIILIFSMGLATAQDEDENSCYGCHLELDPPYSDPAEHFPMDVHVDEGLSCTGCHGGDSEEWDYDEAKDASTGFVGIPEGIEIVEMCSKCHSQPAQMRQYDPNMATDQESKYWISGHGKALAAGSEDAAQCVSCHSVHDIRKSTDPGSTVFRANIVQTCASCHSDALIMENADIAANIPDHYSESVHGLATARGDRGTPTCNTCHGNHGAAPPDVRSIKEVCGLCHPNNQELFNQSIMSKVFAEKGLHDCAVCHTAHDIQLGNAAMIGMGPDNSCSSCHEPGTPATMNVMAMRNVLDSLDHAMETAIEALEAAETKGLEVGAGYLELQTARAAHVKSRTAVHSFDIDELRTSAGPGFVSAAAVVTETFRLAIDFKNRRVGLGITTILISLLAFTLFLYIRTLDEK